MLLKVLTIKPTCMALHGEGKHSWKWLEQKGNKGLEVEGTWPCVGGHGQWG